MGENPRQKLGLALCVRSHVCVFIHTSVPSCLCVCFFFYACIRAAFIQRSLITTHSSHVSHLSVELGLHSVLTIFSMYVFEGKSSQALETKEK